MIQKRGQIINLFKFDEVIVILLVTINQSLINSLSSIEVGTGKDVDAKVFQILGIVLTSLEVPISTIGRI